MVILNAFPFQYMKVDQKLNLCVLTGLPGTGKSTTSDILKCKLEKNWKILHADDFNLETVSKYRRGNEKWSEIRQHRPTLIGKEAGSCLSQGKNVLIEGNLKDETEIKNLSDSIREAFQNDFNLKIILLRGNFEMIVKRCVLCRKEEPQYGGSNKEDNCRRYLNDVSIQVGIANVIIDVDGLYKEEIADEVLKHINS